jgi:hypothetical protein
MIHLILKIRMNHLILMYLTNLNYHYFLMYQMSRLYLNYQTIH